MPILKKDATTEQQMDYINTLLKAKSAVGDAIVLLSTIKALTGDPNETNVINVKLLDLEAENAKLQAKLIAFGSQQASFNPPSESTIEDVKVIADELDQMVAEAGKASQVISLATTLLEKWN